VLVICDLFNPLAFSNVGAFTKKNWMAEGIAEISNFHIVGNTALTGLILSLLLFFQAWHVAIVDKLTAHIMFGPRVEALTPPRNKQEIEAYICHLSDHKGVIMTFRKALTPNVQWPEVDPAMKQDIAIFEREE